MSIDQVGTAVEIPEQLAGVSAEIVEVVARARAIEVTSDALAQEATGLLVEIKSRKDRTERARKFLIADPQNQIKKFNSICKATAAPLVEAESIVRVKLSSYLHEQQIARAEEQARLNAERIEAETAAAAECRKAEEEARRAEREAAELEAKRQAEIKAADSERRQVIAAMSDAELHTVNITSDDYVLATAELAARGRAREAQEHAENARREAEEATQRSIAAQSAPTVQVAPPTPLATAAGRASVTHRWKATVIDETRVPRQYLKIDQAAINAAVREGVREIPGVEIKQEVGLAVGTHG